MTKATVDAGGATRELALLAVLVVLLTGETQRSGDAQAPALNTPREVWVAIREDGRAGAGTVTDPFDGGSVEKLNGLFDKFGNEYGDNLTVHFGPGVFYGNHTWSPRDNWKIRGAGMDITVFKSKPDPEGIGTVGFREGGYTGGPSGFELSDCTFDFNTPNLRKANRAFLFPWGNGWRVGYFYAKELPEWSREKEYGQGQAVTHKGVEYMALGPSKGQEPAQGLKWSLMHLNRSGQVPGWKEGRTYGLGDAAQKAATRYLCTAANTTTDPATDRERWQPLHPDAPDPMIYTHAAFVHTQPPGGRHRVSRVKAINGNGSWFFGREAFVIGLGGNDCVIEDCLVDQFRGDYASLIVMTFGQHGVIRGCTVRGNGGLCTMAYGGWACWDTVFEDNFCTNVRSATNIDSLNCRNVTFRNNVFMNCLEVGILVNVGGNVIENHRQYGMVIDGKPIKDFARSCMDGLFIYNNLVEMRDGAPYGAIQAQAEGLRDVRICGNVLRTTSGQGRARAIGVLRAENATVHDNLCEPNMYCEIIPPVVGWHNNLDLLGQPMKDLQGRPITSGAAEKATPAK